MSVGRRVTFNFEELFDDHRKLSLLFVDPNRFKIIKDVILHIQASFDINEPLYLIENGVLLPDFEDIHLLIYSTHDIKVKKFNFSKINSVLSDKEHKDDFESIHISKKKKRKKYDDKLEPHGSCISNMDTSSSITDARNSSYDVFKEKFNGSECEISSSKIENVNIPTNITETIDTASENLQLENHNGLNDLDENEFGNLQKKRKRIRRRKRKNQDEICTKLSSDVTYEVGKLVNYNNNEVHKKNRHVRFKSDDDDSHSNEDCKIPSNIEPVVKDILNVHSSEKNQNKLISENKNTQNDTTLPLIFNCSAPCRSVTSSNDKVVSKDNNNAKNVLIDDTLCQELPKKLFNNGDFLKKQDEFVGENIDLCNDDRTTTDKQDCNKKNPVWINELIRIKEINQTCKFFKPPMFNRIPKSSISVITTLKTEASKSAVQPTSEISVSPTVTATKPCLNEINITASISNGSNNSISNAVNHSFSVDDIVNFQLLFLGDNYTPTLSEMVLGKVIAVSEELIQLKILIGKEVCKPLTGRFALTNREENYEDYNYDCNDIIELHVRDLINPKKIINPFPP